MRSRIRAIDVMSAMKTGLLVGMATSVLPLLLTILAIMFHLGAWLQSLLKPWWGSLLFFAAGIILVGLLSALWAMLAALAYNSLAVRAGGLEAAVEPAPAHPTIPSEQAVTLPPAQLVPPAPQTLTVGSGASGMPGAPTLTPVPLGYAPPVGGPPSQPTGPGDAPTIQPSVSVPMPAPVAAPAVPNNPAPVLAAVGPRLTLESNPSVKWPINKPVFTIGSASGADLCATGLSPQHATIEYDITYHVYLLRDLAGQVSVNGWAVQTVSKLNDGAKVQVGSLRFVFYL